MRKGWLRQDLEGGVLAKDLLPAPPDHMDRRIVQGHYDKPVFSVAPAISSSLLLGQHGCGAAAATCGRVWAKSCRAAATMGYLDDDEDAEETATTFSPRAAGGDGRLRARGGDNSGELGAPPWPGSTGAEQGDAACEAQRGSRLRAGRRGGLRARRGIKLRAGRHDGVRAVAYGRRARQAMGGVGEDKARLVHVGKGERFQMLSI